MNRISTGGRKKGEEKYPLFEIRYQMVDGRKNLLILFAAIIEVLRRLDNLESMPDNNPQNSLPRQHRGGKYR